MDWLLTLRIARLAFLLPVNFFAVALFLFLLYRRPHRSIARGIVAAVLGAVTGLTTVWLVGDIGNVFGTRLSGIFHMWIALLFAGVFLAAYNLRGTRWWRKGIAIFAILVFCVTSAAGVNVDFQSFRNLNDALALSPFPALPMNRLSSHSGTMEPALATSWHSPAGMPAHGTVGMVTIPGKRSHFATREGVVYLPPAALVANAPVLPVLVLLSGQPGAPIDMFTWAQVPATLDAYAAQHDGLAPIVVVPDQLGSPLRNPMCADSRMGRSATYLTQDVPAWIRSHLRVATSSRYWAIGGYSEGGTCAIQLGAGHPELFQSIIDILGEREPTMGPNTLAAAFGGSRSAYDAIKPLPLLAHHAPYRDSVAIFGAGDRDRQYRAYVRDVRSAANRAGMKTELIESQNSGHDWNTVRYVLARALPELSSRLGL